MPIETELSTGFSFRNNYQRGSVNIIYTAGYVNNFYESFFKPYQLTSQQYNILRILREKYPDPISTSVLRDLMLDKMSDVSRLVSRLATKELVSVNPNPADKRLVDILITEKGLRLLEEIDKHLYKLDSMLQHMTEEEVIQLSNLLDKARASVQKTKL